MSKVYERSFVAQLEQRLAGQPLIQVLVGPHQVGKTTGVKQLIARYPERWSGFFRQPGTGYKWKAALIHTASRTVGNVPQ